MASAKATGGQSTALGEFEEKKMVGKANRVGALAENEEDCSTVGFGGVGFGGVATLFFSAIPGSTPTAVQGNPANPNFVFTLADDMRKDDLKYMPKTRSLLGNQGMQFEKAFVSLPLCCPSRATIMRGQYAHNTGVWRNSSGPEGDGKAT
jgi:hypothetical protein